jgi:cell division protein FtsI (penicillin-binding protein 3)
MKSELRDSSNSKLKTGRSELSTHNSKLPQIPRFRLLLVWGLMVTAGLGILVNLYRLQVTQASMLEGRARQQQMVYLRPFVPRRPIVDRNGNVHAICSPQTVQNF